MKLILFDSEDIELRCVDDLLCFIPEHLTGKVLNYGQGEGQFEIERTVWGVYVNNDNYYYIAYEEGGMDWSNLAILVDSILKSVNEAYTKNMCFVAEGPIENEPES
jgi:hypothetical protein